MATKKIMATHKIIRLVISKHWTGLWTGLLDWTDELDYWT